MTSYFTDKGILTAPGPVASKICNGTGHFSPFHPPGFRKKKRPDTAPASQRELCANPCGINTCVGCGAQPDASQHTQHTAFASQQRKQDNTFWNFGLSPLLGTSTPGDYIFPKRRNIPNVYAVKVV
jgi:hypothetical protein